MMLLTEDEARTKWCPFADEVNNCIASGCMAWRWWGTNHEGVKHGFCGLAVPPELPAVDIDALWPRHFKGEDAE